MSLNEQQQFPGGELWIPTYVWACNCKFNPGYELSKGQCGSPIRSPQLQPYRKIETNSIISSLLKARVFLQACSDKWDWESVLMTHFFHRKKHNRKHMGITFEWLRFIWDMLGTKDLNLMHTFIAPSQSNKCQKCPRLPGLNLNFSISNHCFT